MNDSRVKHRKRRAVIIGGSMSGLFTAAFLRQIGWDIDVMAKAGGDAQALAQTLGSHDDIDSGLADYNRIRQPFGERILMHGRKLGTHLGVNLQTEEERAMWRPLQDHRAMMDWIAVPNFLAASTARP
jgi:2-polyprenyl-6-methoxyphenol hydroxylase-like FAD-dependent oxidoreductase